MISNTRLKRSLLWWTLFVVFSIGGGLAGKYLGKVEGKQEYQRNQTLNGDESRSQIYDTLKTISHNANKTTPVYIDKLTRLDATSVENDSMVFYLTVPTISIKQINIEEFTNAVRMQMVAGYKMNSDFKYMREHNITIIAKCRDKDGIYFSTIPVSPKDF